jgi:arylsulfatase A-like enzyme
MKSGPDRHRPNIIIIYPDQMRGDAFGSGGNPVVKTAHIDRLAYEGVRFSNAYTAYPLCAPFRASLFTGKYPHAHGVRANHYAIPLGQNFLAEIFRQAGYQTGYIGKWHLDGGQMPGFVPPGERRLGFDHFVGFNRGHHYNHSVFFKDTDQPYTSLRYEADYQTDHLLSFLDSCHRDPAERPFLAMVCYGIPHPPLAAPSHYIKLYSPDEVQLNDSVPPGSESRSKEFLAKYYGLVSCVDHNVGRILNWLDKSNLAENTVVVFVSDHGEMAGEHGLFGKRNCHRGATHVPLLVRYPQRFHAGIVVDNLVDPSVDIMPTLLELCDLDVPDAVQGHSFLSLLEGDTGTTRPHIFHQILKEKGGPEPFPVPVRGIRTEDWLFVRSEDQVTALYDLVSDPAEIRNLAGSPDHRSIVLDLESTLTEYMSAVGDDWNVEAVFPPADFMTYAQGEENTANLFAQAIREN